MDALTAQNNAKDVKSDLARAQRLLAKGEFERALDTALAALRLRRTGEILPRDVGVIDSHIADFCVEFNGSLTAGQALESLGVAGRKAFLEYRPGGDRAVANRLAALRLRLAERQAGEAASESAAEDSGSGVEEAIAQGVALLRAGNQVKGRLALRRVAEEHGGQPGVRLRVARILLDAESWGEAAETLRAAVQASPKDQTAWRLLVSALKAQEKPRETEQALHEMLKRFGPQADLFLDLARACLAQDKRDEAFRHARKAQELAPDSPEARELLDHIV